MKKKRELETSFHHANRLRLWTINKQPPPGRQSFISSRPHPGQGVQRVSHTRVVGLCYTHQDFHAVGLSYLSRCGVGTVVSQLSICRLMTLWQWGRRAPSFVTGYERERCDGECICLMTRISIIGCLNLMLPHIKKYTPAQPHIHT